MKEKYPPKPVITCAIYARYSSDKQSKASAQDQIDRIKRKIKTGQVQSRRYSNAEYVVLDEWVHRDEAVSGKTPSRRGYKTILQGIRSQSFEMILVDDLSRLTRDLGNLYDLYRLLQHHEVELISISDCISSDDPSAKTLFSVKGMVADFGNDAHAERTRRGLEARALKFYSTGPKPYGFKSRHTEMDSKTGKKSHFQLYVDPEEAKVVREVYELHLKGHGRIYIVKHLKAKGILPPKGCRRGWTESVIRKMLLNEKYKAVWVTGRTKYSKDPDTGKRVIKTRPQNEWVITKPEHLRIIDDETWERASKIFQQNLEEYHKKFPGRKRIPFGKRRQVHGRHLLSGILKCPDCEGVVVLVSGKGQGYYGCYSAHRQGSCCNKILIPKNKVEGGFLKAIKGLILADDSVIKYALGRYRELLREYQKGAPDKQRELEKEADKLGVELQNLVNLVAQGNIGDSKSISEAINNREGKKSKINQQLKSLSKSSNKEILITPKMLQQSFSEFIDQLQNEKIPPSGLLNNLLAGPVWVKKKKGTLHIEGTLNLGSTIGSIDCALASPTGVEPVSPP